MSFQRAGDQSWKWLWSNHKKLLAGKSDVSFKELMGAFLGRIKGWRLKIDLQLRGDSDMIQRRQGGLQAGYRVGKSCWAWLSQVSLNWLHFHKSGLQVLQAWEKEGTEKWSSLLQITQHVRDSRESSLGSWASGSMHATQELCCLAAHWFSRKLGFKICINQSTWCSSWHLVAIIYYFFCLWVSMYVAYRHACLHGRVHMHHPS